MDSQATDIYAAIYSQQLQEEGRWLEMCGPEKANSVRILLRRNGIQTQTIAELGAGTGAVIRELKKQRLAADYLAVDSSPLAISYLAEHDSAIRTLVMDITAPCFTLDRHYDVLVLSHVLEHLRDPENFLNIVHRLSWDWLVAEVPLEDLPLCRAKLLFTNTRADNRAGHVQFFTAGSFERLLTKCGLTVIDRRRYSPALTPQMIGFQARKNGVTSLKQVQMMLTGWVLPNLMGPLWRWLYLANYAVLAIRSGDRGQHKRLSDD